MQMHLLAKATDAPRIAHLHAQCFADAWSSEYIESLLVQPAIFALIGEEGFILVQVAGDESEVLSLGVTPAARRRGLGSALVVAAIEEARKRGASAMFLEVERGNCPAITLYKRHGFNQVGCRSGYYGGAGAERSDALVMRAQIAPATVGNGMQLG